MRIHIVRRKSKNRGAANFLNELARELDRQGHKIVDKRPHISLASVHPQAPHGGKAIVRIDGVYYDVARKNMNKSIRNGLQRADGIVYQSNFSKNMVHNMVLHPNTTSVVIPNGIDQRAYSGLKREKEAKYVFAACAHWRINKRPREIVKSFVRADINNSLLYMIGDIESKFVIKHEKVRYLGNLKRKDLLQTYRNSDYLIHICHIDSCPNSVVEALSAGMPVICNNISGTPELVKDSGIIADLDPPFNYKFIPTIGHVPKINMDNLTQAIQDITKKEYKVNRPDLDISNVTKKYVEFFEKILRRK